MTAGSWFPATIATGRNRKLSSSDPSSRLRERDPWSGQPPDPLAEPALYDGVLWRRIGAYAVDLAILAVLSVAAWVALTTAGVLSFGLLMPLVPVALVLLPIAYHALLVGGSGAATLGMRLFGLQVRSWTGERPAHWQAALMSALFYATIAVTGSLILLVALFNSRYRTLHDFLSGTVVVRHPAGPPLARR